MKVPFIDILRYENGFYETVTAKTAELIKNGHFVGGPVVGQFGVHVPSEATMPLLIFFAPSL